MIRTIQPLCQTTIEKAGKTEADGNIMDDNIRGLLSICDSLKNLSEKLSRLEYITAPGRITGQAEKRESAD